MNTKLNMFCVVGYKSEDEKYIFEKIMLYFNKVKHACCYKFPITMPVALEVVEVSTKEVKATGFFKKKETVIEVPWYHYNLVFDKELSEAELNMWRMFKLGWRSRPPYRSWDF